MPAPFGQSPQPICIAAATVHGYMVGALAQHRAGRLHVARVQRWLPFARRRRAKPFSEREWKDCRPGAASAVRQGALRLLPTCTTERRVATARGRFQCYDALSRLAI